MPATTAIFDFTNDAYAEEPLPLTGTRAPMNIGARGGIIGGPVRSMDPKRIRARARKKMQIANDEIALLYGGRGVESWDLEELAAGRPRDVNGKIPGGKPPAWIDRSVHEQIVKRFEEVVRNEMNGYAVGALEVMGKILEDDAVDMKGRPRTGSSTKLDAAKFLIEHVIGKPKVRTETDISVKLQGILGHAMVNPVEGSDFTAKFAPTQGYIEAASSEVDDDE